MTSFNSLYIEYENTKDVCKFCSDHAENSIATRFLLVRSLDKENLKDIINLYSDKETDGPIKALAEKVYDSPVTIDQLVAYIEEKREELIRQREAELDGLEEVLADFPIASCGVRNDKVDDIVKSFVRDKSLKSRDDLVKKLENTILPRVFQYCLWSYYNQTSNDIIELFFLRHKAVIPTLRKIHDIDFFLKIGDNIIPFDLKFTHISDEYFDLMSQGISRNTDENYHDDFCAGHDFASSESKIMKAYYREYKRTHKATKLPNLRGLEKNDICEILVNTGDAEALQFVSERKQQHEQYIPTTANALHVLEWWNYKYQGERLFCNNNR